jgi:uncharacterized protein (TIGR02996 family)
MADAERAELNDRLARVVTKPLRSDLGGRPFLLWSQRDDSGSAQVMVWTPETEDELRGAALFYDAAHGLGDFARPVKAGKPARRSPEHDAFIRAILRRRDDETAYLAYADYLTERGDSQGDYIRLCIELAKLPPAGPEAEEKNRRLNELSDAHAEEWFAPLGELGLRPETLGHFSWYGWMSLERGVIETVSIDRPGIFPRHAARLFAAAPFLRRLEFERGHLDPAALAKVKQLDQIEELELGWTDLTPEGLSALLRSKYLTGLKSLGLSGNRIADGGATALVTWPGLARLESLDVSNCSLTDADVATLANSPAAGNLKRLFVGRNAAPAETAATVVASKQIKKHTELEIAGTTFDLPTARQFGGAAFARTLRRLDLDSATFQPGAFFEFTRCKLPALQSLKLNSVELRGAGASCLAAAAWREALTELYLDVCRIGPGGAELLAGGHFPRLEKLDLSRNAIGTRGGLALAGAAKNFPALTSLRLRDDKLTPEAAVRLAASPILAKVTHLELNDNKVGPAGALALAKSKHLTKVTYLVIDEKQAGKKGRQALIDRFGESVVSFR